jgi:hypothetical protein
MDNVQNCDSYKVSLYGFQVLISCSVELLK